MIYKNKNSRLKRKDMRSSVDFDCWTAMDDHEITLFLP